MKGTKVYRILNSEEKERIIITETDQNNCTVRALREFGEGGYLEFVVDERDDEVTLFYNREDGQGMNHIRFGLSLFLELLELGTIVNQLTSTPLFNSKIELVDVNHIINEVKK